jgi:hypothetical protein
VKDSGVSGVTPQLGWPELLGHVSTVDVPVGGRLALVALSVSEHDPELPLKFAVTASGAFIVTVVEVLEALATAPVQPLKVYPELAVAPIFTTVPAV